MSPSLCSVYLVALLYTTLYFIDLMSLVLVFVSSSVNYLLVRSIHQHKHQTLLITIGVFFALAPLILFKFFPTVLREIPTSSSILFTVGVPIGLSFYALQQITALLDCRKHFTPILPYHKHLLYLGFFPNFIAGPILPYKDAVAPIQTLGYKTIPESWIGNGLILFLVGLCKKLWIADPIGGAVNHMITKIQDPNVSMNIFEAWFVVWGFLVQLYFDFSAYSDMAIGLALCFGILLPMNFDSPLKSYSAQEYISRWHISFTGFVRVYFFIPMLGVLKKLPIKNTEKRMAISWSVGMLLSYIVIGIWHAPNLVIMASSTMAIIVLFLIKIPNLMSNTATNTLPSNKFKKHLNRALLLLFSMLMAMCLKIQDVDILTKIYLSLIHFDKVYLPDYVENIVPNFIKPIVSFTGVSPLLDNYAFGEHLFNEPKVFFLSLIVATMIIFLSPNSMTIFGIKDSNYNTQFRHGVGAIFYILFLILFFIVIYALIFENNQIQNFIYERF